MRLTHVMGPGNHGAWEDRKRRQGDAAKANARRRAAREKTKAQNKGTGE